jgi:hypothetical protein
LRARSWKRVDELPNGVLGFDGTTVAEAVAQGLQPVLAIRLGSHLPAPLRGNFLRGDRAQRLQFRRPFFPTVGDSQESDGEGA